MTRVPVLSSAIAEIGYDESTHLLEVMFPGRGATPPQVWSYQPVDVRIYEELMSPGAAIGSLFAVLVKRNPLIVATRVEDSAA